MKSEKKSLVRKLIELRHGGEFDDEEEYAEAYHAFATGFPAGALTALYFAALAYFFPEYLLLG